MAYVQEVRAAWPKEDILRPAAQALAGAADVPTAGRPADLRQHRGLVRARPHCCFVPPLIHFTPDSLTYSASLFMKRQFATEP
jgi:hypothetical protein